MGDIVTAEAIDANWLTARLREHGHPDATVRSVRKGQIGTGQIGKCIRFEMDVEGDDAAPRSLVGKFPSDDELSRATGVQLQNYLKEVSFYRELQRKVAIRTPRCYHAEIEGAGPEFALLLEDLTPARQGDQLEGVGPDVACAAVRELAGLHASSWNDDTLLGIEWLGGPTEESGAMVRALYRAQLPGFLERYGPALTTEQADVIAAFGHSDRVLGVPPAGPRSIVHVDFRPDNLLIDTQTCPPRVTTVDWQSLTLGNPLADLAYFVGGGLRPEVRAACEDQIVQAYREALEAAGIRDYGDEDFRRDYRLGAFAGFSVTVVASMLVQRTERGDAMFAAMAQRHAQHAIDLQAAALL